MPRRALLPSSVFRPISFYAACAKCSETALRAPRFSCRCTARAYRMKFCPATGYRAKNSVGSSEPLRWLQAWQAETRLPG